MLSIIIIVMLDDDFAIWKYLRDPVGKLEVQYQHRKVFEIDVYICKKLTIL